VQEHRRPQSQEHLFCCFATTERHIEQFREKYDEQHTTVNKILNFSWPKHLEGKFRKVISTVFRKNSHNSELQHGDEAEVHFSSMYFYKTTRRYNPEDSHLRTHRCENLKPYMYFLAGS
jgi:hypothetical protein